ncbi:hypothetical protein AB0C59_28005 [Streptomyces sp. NPDC048664]|uniref:hypothetical protein n=1 Tax=Streptomyces sp. NPDC048664 TaxID=3154505 RepID=UPI0034193183
MVAVPIVGAMGRIDDTRDDALGAGARTRRSGRTAYDRRWRAELRSALRCAALLLVMLLVIDRVSGGASWWRAALWLALSLLLVLVLVPRRVSAGEGLLASRGLFGTRRVRTDRLVSVRCLDGVCRRLVLRDVSGTRVELDPQVLVDNPDLWYLLDEGARRSEADGVLLCGATALRHIQDRIDRETARAVFRGSGLD